MSHILNLNSSVDVLLETKLVYKTLIFNLSGQLCTETYNL